RSRSNSDIAAIRSGAVSTKSLEGRRISDGRRQAVPALMETAAVSPAVSPVALRSTDRLPRFCTKRGAQPARPTAERLDASLSFARLDARFQHAPRALQLLLQQ